MSGSDPFAIHEACMLIEKEALRAIELHGPMRSGHEGKSVIEEEFDELWDAIKLYPKHDVRDWQREAAHVGAMAARFIADVCLVSAGSAPAQEEA